jgi:2-succinyl-6-hydroxy-2,4-cyclohexadiene-1-carboxylate synthase
LVHGFAGHGESWAEVAGQLAAKGSLAGKRTVASLTLPGHDPASSIEAGERFEEILDHIILCINESIRAPFEAVGYSMGGRVVLALLERRPELVSRAVLIGANPGIEDAGEREARARWERDWAELLAAEGIEAFVEQWEKLPIFATQEAVSPAAAARQRRVRLRHDPDALAAAMRGLGLAEMPNYWPELPRIDAPVRLVAGERDEKFRALAERMAGLLPHAEITIVPGAGHNVVLERPEDVARLLGP